MLLANSGVTAGLCTPAFFNGIGGVMERLNEHQRGSGFHGQQGFSLIQLLITGAVIIVVSSFAFFAIDTARASMRLSGSTRELAGYLEKARSNAIRRNGTAIVSIVDGNNYTVQMDFDGDGTTETRTIGLSSGVSFVTGSIGISTTFDWRGRTTNQVGIGLQNTHGATNSINISGSGDITLGDEIFQDSAIGDVTLNSNVNATVAAPTPDPYATPGASPSPSPSASPSPSPSASPTPSPSPSPTPVGCSISAPTSVTFRRNRSPQVISVTITNAVSVTVTATKSGDISTLSPTSTTVSGNGTIPYTITYPNGNISSGTVSVTSPCGNKTIDVIFN